MTPNRAVAIIDSDLDEMLLRPQMWSGPSMGTFELLVLSLLSVRERILEVDVDSGPRAQSWRRVSHALLVEMTGKGSGACGASSRLREFYGEDAFDLNHPNFANVMLFYREFVKRMRDAMDVRTA